MVKEWLMGSDRLNTVVAVLLVIWMGLAIHLWRLTRRVEKLEKKTLSAHQSSEAAP